MNTQADIMFKLYIIEKSPTSKDTISKLRSFLDSNFKSGYSLDVIDILTYPEMAVKDNIMASPTLIKEKPFPPKRIVGGIHLKNLISEFNLSAFLIN